MSEKTAIEQLDEQLAGGRPISFEVLEHFEHVHKHGAPSHYVPELRYTLHAGNDELAADLRAWLEAGKARLAGPTAPGSGPGASPSRVAGTGLVT